MVCVVLPRRQRQSGWLPRPVHLPLPLPLHLLLLALALLVDTTEAQSLAWTVRLSDLSTTAKRDENITTSSGRIGTENEDRDSRHGLVQGNSITFVSLSDEEDDTAASSSLASSSSTSSAAVALLAVTTHSGTLHLLNATTSEPMASYTPPSLAEDMVVSCVSSVTVIRSGSLPHQQEQRRRRRRRGLQPDSTTEESPTEPEATTTAVPSTTPPAVWIVYAVRHTSSNSNTNNQSQVLAVDATTGQLVWNITVNGSIQGTPVHSSLHNVLYVVHNSAVTSSSTSSTTASPAPTTTTTIGTSSTEAGQVSIFALPTVTSSTPTLLSVLPTVSTGRPFGPPSNLLVTTTTTTTASSNDRKNGNTDADADDTSRLMDVLLVADATETDGFGALFVVTAVVGTEMTTTDADATTTSPLTTPEFTFAIASTFLKPTLTAPVIVSIQPTATTAMTNEEEEEDGATSTTTTQAVFLGQPASYIAAWLDGNEQKLWHADLLQAEQERDDTDSAFWGSPTWGFPSQANAEDPSNSLPVSPTVSTDGRHLFLASAGTEVSSYPLDQNTATGWVATDASSVVLARPVYHEGTGGNATTDETSSTSNAAVVYFIESQGGIVRQYNVETGILEWDLDCDSDDNDRACPNVESDFALAPDGSMLYYGDVDGNVRAIQVTETTAWLLPPTLAPTDAPSVRPSLAPVRASVPKSNRTSTAPNRKPSRRSPTASPMITIQTNVPTVASIRSVGVSSGTTAVESNSSSTLLSQSLLIYLLAAICGALVILIGFVMRKRNKVPGRRKKHQRSNIENDIGKSPDGMIRSTWSTPTKGSNKSMANETYGSPAMHSRTPMTLPCIAESPDDEEEQLSIGFEVGMDKTVVESEPEVGVRDLEGIFASVKSDIERGDASPIARILTPDAADDNYSTNSGTRSDGQSVESDGSASFVTRSILAMASAVGVMTNIPYIVEKKDDDRSIYGVLEKPDRRKGDTKDMEPHTMSPRLSQLVISPAASVDMSVCSRVSSETAQIIAHSPSEEQSIASRTESMNRSIESSRRQEITRFTATIEQAVNPIASPTIVYPVATKKVDASSPKWSSSPTGSVLSLDESLYTDEHTVLSLEMPLQESLNMKSGTGNVSSEVPATLPSLMEDLQSDCPEDEMNSKLQPGASYLNRHRTKNEIAQNESTTFRQPIAHSEANRTSLPMYKGVSVRPASRSRAGIFSRRQPQVLRGDRGNGDDSHDDDDEHMPESSSRLPVVAGTPEVTPEPVKRWSSPGLVIPPRTEAKVLERPMTPTHSLQPVSEPPPSPVSPPRFTSAGFYVEETTKDKADVTADIAIGNTHGDDGSNFSVDSSVHKQPSEQPRNYDPWGSFLTELSRVESQFFNPTSATNITKPKSRSLGKGQAPALPPSPPVDIDSDDGDNDVPPPAPRTFYA